MVTIVSGLPRSGTSLMMQMLAAGGLPILTDGLRAPDEDNPRGYNEWEKIKTLPQNPGCIAEAEGKVVKVISSLLMSIPQDRTYQVIFMCRPLEEVVTSQAVMIERRGTTGPRLPAAAMLGALTAHANLVTSWLKARTNLEVCWVEYHTLLSEPLDEAHRIAKFLDAPLNTEAMAAQVDPSLCRQREKQNTERS
jgi:hypothetical protein